jgi:hypothetical protein
VTGTAPAAMIWPIAACAISKLRSGLPGMIAASPQSTGASASTRSKSQVAL